MICLLSNYRASAPAPKAAQKTVVGARKYPKRRQKVVSYRTRKSLLCRDAWSSTAPSTTRSNMPPIASQP